MITVRGKIVFVLLVLCIASATAQVAENVSIHVLPGAEIPLGTKSTLFNPSALYRIGASGSITGQYIFPKTPFLYTEGQFSWGVHPTQAQTPLMIGSAGIAMGVDLRLADGLSLQLKALGGGSLGLYGDLAPAGNPYAGGGLAAVLDITPGLALSLGGTYKYHLGWDGSAYTDLYQGIGVYAGTVLRIKPESGRQKLLVADVKTDPLFPVFYGYYENHPFGSLKIQNLENSAITNVDISFYIGEYMEQPMLTKSFPTIKRNETVQVPLMALFTSRMLNLTERSKASSEVSISYTYLGERFTYSQPLTITILDRNSMTWDDDRKAASFVTPRDPTVMIFSKNTAGIIRDQGSNPLSLNFRIAMGIFEAMRIYGLNYVIDPASSFAEISQSTMTLDYLQFPSQSLIYRAGDCDDLSILYSALLESVGIETAFITIPGHIYMAFSLDMTEADARRTFSSAENFIYVNDKAWVPIEITLVQEGFLKAYHTGVKQWKEAVKKNVQGFFPVHTAWETFEPVGFVGSTLSLLFPSATAIIDSYKTNLDAFVTQEIQSRVEHFESTIKKGGERASLRNSYGILYARYGVFDKAREQFETALKLDSRSYQAMINLANLSFLQEEMAEARTWYQRASLLKPDNPLVVAGMARTSFELEDYETAQREYHKLEKLDPKIASEYAYIGTTSTSIIRASAARDKGTTLWEGED